MQHGRKIVMLVDDDSEFLYELRESLALSGYIPMPAVNGREAMKLSRKIKPDVILLDLKLGTENGLEVAARIRKDPATARIPVIMMSAYFSGLERLGPLAPSPVNIYLSKPFSQKDVILSIQAVLAGKAETPFDPIRHLVEKSRKKVETDS